MIKHHKTKGSLFCISQPQGPDQSACPSTTSTPSASSKSSKISPIPKGPLVLRTLIENQDPMPKCTCDIYDPEAYRSIRNCRLHPHARVKLERSESLNRYGEKCHAPLKVGVGIANCEVMHPARRTIEYFDMPKEHLNDIQLNALAQLNEWRDSRIKDILSEEDNKDFDKLVSQQETRQL
jgi:hypothetical protein